MAIKSTLASFPITHYVPGTAAFSLFITQPRLLSNWGPWPLFSPVSVVLNKGCDGPSFGERSGDIFCYPSDYTGDPIEIGWVVYSKVSQLYVYIDSPLFWISCPFRSLQSIESSSQCYTVGSH